MSGDLHHILFLCVQNSARSQMAEGLTRHLMSHKFEVTSAGSSPAKRVHPMAIAAMAEIGIDISHQKPKSIDSINLERMDVVILLCAEEFCPTLPDSVPKESWHLPDPAAATGPHTDQLRRFRKIRDELKHRILQMNSSNQTF